jgi:transcription elongation factor Elf1
MGKGRQKWKREHLAWADKKQAKFDHEGQMKVSKKPIITVQSRYSMTQQFACPFCLGIYEFQRFLISTKKGIHQGLVECPECKNKCRISTLTGKMTPEEYAEYIYNQVRSGVWQKMPFSKWSDRLKRIGWAPRFWKAYHQLKSEDTESDIEEQWDAYQESWAKESGYIK